MNDNILEAFPIASDAFFNACVYSNEAGLHFVGYKAKYTYDDPAGVNNRVSLGNCKEGHGMSLKLVSTVCSATFHMENIECVKLVHRDRMLDPSFQCLSLFFFNRDIVTITVTHRFASVISYMIESKMPFEDAERKFYGLFKTRATKVAAIEPKITSEK